MMQRKIGKFYLKKIGWKPGNRNKAERISFIKTVYPAFDVEHVFPYKNQLSETIDYAAFACSHLIQPDLFLRIRPGNSKQVMQKLQENRIDFALLNETCLALNNTTKLDAVLEINKEVVVQDYSSQQIAQFLSLSTTNHQPSTKVWDCCAASGGKSILAYDLNNKIDLTVSDLRPSILHNLKQRFKEAGIKKYHSFIADLTKYPASGNHASTYDLIICDAPCSGSGTWSRTPEQLNYFKEEEIERYAVLQKKIIRTVIPALKKNGFFLYITCSVFKKENEDQVNFIQQEFHLQLQRMELLKGYDKKADTMFAALFAHSS